MNSMVHQIMTENPTRSFDFLELFTVLPVVCSHFDVSHEEIRFCVEKTEITVKLSDTVNDAIFYKKKIVL